MDDCIFCNIVNKKINAKIIKETEDWVCFEDATPKAPLHYLIIPRTHIENFHSVEQTALYSSIMMGIKDIVLEKSIDQTGYRIVINSGADGGQSVFHLHFHLLAKRGMGWPPG